VEADEVDVVGRLEVAAQHPAAEPDAHRVLVGVVEVGVDGEHVAHLHLEAGLLGHFPGGRHPHVLVPFHVAAGDAPQPRVGTAPPGEQQAVGPVEEDDGHADGGVVEHHPGTARAVGT
jgi:hypothetical protein